MQYITKNPLEIKYLAKRLKEARKTLGYTQRALSQLAGITDAMLCLYERGHSTPSFDVLLSLSRALNVSLDYFVLNGSEDNIFSNTENLTHQERRQIQEFIDTLVKYKKGYLNKKNGI